MNKSELAQAIADRSGLDKKQVEDTLTAFVDVVTSTISAGGNVTIAGFGDFSARVRKGRIGVNPQDPSKSIEIPSVPVPKFKAGSRLKKAVKEGSLGTGDNPSTETSESSFETTSQPNPPNPTPPPTNPPSTF